MISDRRRVFNNQYIFKKNSFFGDKQIIECSALILTQNLKNSKTLGRILALGSSLLKIFKSPIELF
jgi:hypothetical protein